MFELLIFIFFAGTAIFWFRNPFSQYPFVHAIFDVSGRRKPDIDILIEEKIDSMDPDISIGLDRIRNWHSLCEHKLERSIFPKHRRRQYEAACMNDSRAFCFSMIRQYASKADVVCGNRQLSVKEVSRRYDRSCAKHRTEEETRKMRAEERERQKQEADAARRKQEADKARQKEERYRKAIREQQEREQKKADARKMSEHVKFQRRLCTPEMKLAVMHRDNYTCQICGKYMPDEVGLHIDHIIPVSKGGFTCMDNLQVLCSKCNGRKSGKMPDRSQMLRQAQLSSADEVVGYCVGSLNVDPGIAAAVASRTYIPGMPDSERMKLAIESFCKLFDEGRI